MELFGIVFFAGVGLIASPIFCLIIENIVARFRIISRTIQVLSIVVVIAFAAEFLLVMTYSPIALRTTLGSAYIYIHELLFLLAAPCLACSVLLRKKPHGFGLWWLLMAPICWLVGVTAIIFQYHVYETLYGIDGTGGPFKFP
mgnify:CR=1 FL=1